MWDSFFGLGFKASKCKTLLRLAMARIKLLRNKRDFQIKQLRKEIAQLLTSGQEPSAHIRVEHIFREENILAAYDILELFCELITVRLPIIESQKLCPLDLKEAISSLIFAAPRCADLPELQQIQGLFAVKYGKEFAAAATELRPDCGVNRRIIEKLSVQAPSGEVKLKLMKEIAAEHNVDWDPTDFEAGLLKAPEDLLDGPTSFLEAHEMPLLSQGKESPVKPLDKDPMAPSTSEPPLPPLRQSSTTLRDLLKQDDNKQFIPFVKMPAVGKEDSPVPPTAPAVHGSEESEKFNSSEELRREKKVDYADVAAAVRAAAESADRAVAAARAAAEFARQQAEHGKVKSSKSQASTAGNVEDSSGTDLDSDSSDGHHRAPARTGISRGRSGSERKPAPDSDFESDDDMGRKNKVKSKEEEKELSTPDDDAQQQAGEEVDEEKASVGKKDAGSKAEMEEASEEKTFSKSEARQVVEEQQQQQQQEKESIPVKKKVGNENIEQQNDNVNVNGQNKAIKLDNVEKNEEGTDESEAKSQSEKMSKTASTVAAEEEADPAMDVDSSGVTLLQDLPTNFQQTVGAVASHVIPQIQQISDQSMNSFDKINRNLASSFLPWIGEKYAPIIATLISYCLLLPPLALVLFLCERIRAILTLQKVLLFINIYLVTYFAILLIVALGLGSEPTAFLDQYSPFGYLILQLLQAFGYMIYMLLQTADVIITCATGSPIGKTSAVIQWLLALMVGLHYYVTVFHRAMAKQHPHISWKFYGFYSLSFLVCCLLARTQQSKKEYIPLGDETTDKKN
ncbi:unnamed protein product [Sphagnum troendelagicum]